MRENIIKFLRKPWFIVSAALLLLFVCGLIVYFALRSAPAPFAGAGTEEDPYLIGNSEDLYAFAEYAGNASDGHAGEHFLLTADIDLQGREWVPAANGASAFAGVFDGDGHTVSHFTIRPERAGTGFFAAIRGGDSAGIYDLTLRGVTVETDEDAHSLGALVGRASARIQNCTVEARISLTGATAYVGGIVGYSDSAVVGCESEGEMLVEAAERLSGSNSTYEWPYYGGIVGNANGNAENCVNRMKLSFTRALSDGSVDRNIHIGGVCGNAAGERYTDLVNEADISGVGAVGGVIGTIGSPAAVVQGCANYGTLFTTGDILCDIGGIVARTYTTEDTLPLIENCYNEGDISLESLLNGSVQGGFRMISCWAGGIVGAGNFNLSSCASVCDIDVSGANTHYVGGVAGGMTGAMKDSYHRGDVIVSSQSSVIAGGVVGVLQSLEYYNGKIEDLLISMERCYNVGLVCVKLADEPLSAAANYLAGGVVGYNMRAENTIRYNYFDADVRAAATIPEGYIGYIYWYGEEVPGQAENVASETISSNAGLSDGGLKGKGAEGFAEYGSGGQNAVWVFAEGEYPVLYWQQ